MEDTTKSILDNLKHGISILNSKYNSEDWDQIEIPVSDFEKEVFECLKTGKDQIPSKLEVLGDDIYLEIRKHFMTKKYNLLNPITDIITDTPTIDNKTKKDKKDKIKIISKSDSIKKQNTLNKLRITIEYLIESFDLNNIENGLYKINILEFRGLTFIFILWTIINKKETYSNSDIMELICSIQRFINTCSDYEGKLIGNNQSLVPVSKTLIYDLQLWLNKIKSIYKFDGKTIYKINPKLIIYSKYDDVIPNRGIKIRPNQKQLLDIMKLLNQK
jgi:hypothetical protein